MNRVEEAAAAPSSRRRRREVQRVVGNDEEEDDGGVDNEQDVDIVHAAGVHVHQDDDDDDDSSSFGYDDDDFPFDDCAGGGGGGGGVGDMTISSVIELRENIVNVPLEQDDPKRLKLTADEYVCASGMRSAFETVSGDHTNVSDFWCAQYAIICNDDKEDAVQKALQLQQVRETYDIADTLEDGLRALRGMVQLQPEFFLSFGFHNGVYVLGLDFSKFDATALRLNHANFKTYMAGWYYLCHAFHCDFYSIRRGVKCVLECQDVTWGMKVDFKIVYQVAQELLSAYPHFSIIEHFNMGYAFSILGKMAMKPLPKEIRDRMIFGSKTPNGEHMSTLYLVPTVEEANERVIRNMQQALKRRYENEQNFSIPIVGSCGGGSSADANTPPREEG